MNPIIQMEASTTAARMLMPTTSFLVDGVPGFAADVAPLLAVLAVATADAVDCTIPSMLPRRSPFTVGFFCSGDTWPG